MYRARFIRGIERIGGFGGKADILAGCEIFEGNPGCYRDTPATAANATPAQVRDIGNAWLGHPSHTFGGHARQAHRAGRGSEREGRGDGAAAGRSEIHHRAERRRPQRACRRSPASHAEVPRLQRATLANGSTLILAERHEIPVVQMSYEFKGGYASDPHGKLGTASFAMGMLDEGAGDMDSLAFKGKAESLGAQVGAGASLDGANAYLSALKENLGTSLQLFSTMLRQPRFEQKDIDRVKAQRIAGIAQEKAQPQTAALRVLPPLLFGADHPYGVPFTGSGTGAQVAALTRDDLVAYQRAWLRPSRPR